MDADQSHVPVHLRQYVVEQDYDAYDPVSHSVWRFVLLHIYERLSQTAHAAYANGVGKTGMNVERIPRISEMNECLGRFGWGAVCVDGFIPPRAFVEFQAARILPIAAEIRSLAHLAYTPAPDILHEAAGHAPILIDPEYRTFIQNFGEIGSKAFTLPAETGVHRAIYALSEVKEDPSSTPEQVARAVQAVAHANAACVHVSESARLARLYWWTAEYGLVGKLDDYKLYGAGLLSSLWESYSCHLPEVRKHPLTVDCTELGYDITRAQPQLFVTPDFSHLRTVLEQVADGLAFRRGPLVAAKCAVDSEQVASFTLSSGVQISGVLSQYLERAGGLAGLQFSERCGLYHNGKPLEWRGKALEIDDYRLPVGQLTVASPSPQQAATQRVASFEYLSGARISGCICGSLRDEQGQVIAVLLSEATVSLPNRPPSFELQLYPVLFGDCIAGHAGAAHPSYHVAASKRHSLVPRPRSRSVSERALLDLYERALEAWRTQGRDLAASFNQIHEALQRQFPDEWLLRWNLLESLLKLGVRTQQAQPGSRLINALRTELESLEIRFQYREPIATGLRSLQQHYSSPFF